MRVNRKLFAILIVVFLLTTLFNINSIAVKTQTLNIVDENSVNDSDLDGYIIQFKEEPLLRFKNRFTEKIKIIFSHLSKKVADVFLSQNVKNHKYKLVSIHRKAKEDILELFGGDDLSEKMFSRGFITLFNGITLKSVPEELVKRIKDLPYVKDVVPNFKISITLDDSVPLISADDMWKMKDAYGRNITGHGVTIAILDTGVDYTHPDLEDNYIQNLSYDFVNDDNDTMDDNGHGTHIAGIAVGKGKESNYQYVGVAPDAKLYVFKILDENGEGNYETYVAGMEASIDPNGDGDTSDHVDIVSLSFGTEEPGNSTDRLCQVADDLVGAGIVVVAAAGNLGDKNRTITSPGCAQNAICVGSTDKDDKIAFSSSRGPVEWNGNYMIKPDIVAPGVSITSTKNGGGYTIKSGTSMATPHIAGAAALILQANPDFSPDEVKSVLKETAVDLNYDPNTQGSGRIDLLRANSTDDLLIIEVPNEIYEKQYFTVNITNKNGSPVKAWILFTVPFHFPRLKYGFSVTFRTPIIFQINKQTLEGKIRVFKKISLSKILQNSYDNKKVITLINNK